jgi:hypothetical protein
MIQDCDDESFKEIRRELSDEEFSDILKEREYQMKLQAQSDLHKYYKHVHKCVKCRNLYGTDEDERYRTNQLFLCPICHPPVRKKK